MAEEIISVLKEAVTEASKAVQAAKDGLVSCQKGPREIVTNCDIASENAIINVLRKKYPDSEILSEEVGEVGSSDDLTFIVDPLDGTHNFIRNIPLYAISIGVYSKGRPHAGMILLPEFNEYFYAIKGSGAFMNGKKISCSSTNALKDAVVAYDNQFHLHKSASKNLLGIIDSCFTLRIFGSACVDLCNIARGTIDARIFHHTKLVDIAAGGIILEEAGGKISDFKGKPLTLKTHDVIATNGKIHDEIVNLLELEND